MKVTAFLNGPDARARRRACVLLSCWVLVLLYSAAAAAEHVVPPEVEHAEPGRWPTAPLARDVSVPVTLVVGADGTVSDAEVDESHGKELDRAALESVRRWRFRPASVEGEPRAAKVRVLVTFVGHHHHHHGASHHHHGAGETVPPLEAADPVEIVVRGEAQPRSAGEVQLQRDLLEVAPQRTGSDLLRLVPGMSLSQHSGEGKANQIFYRGFDAVHGQDLEVSVGGVPVNEVSNIHGQGYADLNFVMPELVQAVEVRPGALRADQGDFAVAGSLVYRLGYDRPGLTASAGVGNFGTRRLFLAFHPENASDETFGAFEVYSSDGFGPARAAERTSAMGQVRHSLGGGLGLRAMASTYAGRFESAGVLRQRDLEAGLVDRFATYDANQGGVSQRKQLAAELTHAAGDWESAFLPYFVMRELRLGFNFTGRLQTGTNDNTWQANDATTVGFRAHSRKTLALIGPRDEVEVGLFTRHDRIRQSQRFSESGERTVNAGVLATDVGAYLDVAMHPVEWTSLRVGARADGLAYTVDDRLAGVERSAQGRQLSPKAMLELAPGGGLTIFAGYGAGFRSPQARSLADGETAPFTRVHSFDAGLVFREGQRWRVAGDVFASLLDNDLVFDERTSRNEAAPRTLRLGGVLSFEARLVEGFISGCSASYTRATFRDSDGRYVRGERVPYVPQLVSRCDLGAKRTVGSFHNEAIVLGAGTGMGGQLFRPLPYNEWGADVFLVDAKLTLDYSVWTLSLDAENLLDVDHYDGQFVYASDFPEATQSVLPERHVTVGAPRTVLGTLSLRL